MNYRIKVIIVNYSVKNKLRDLIFGYVIAVIMTVRSLNYLRHQPGFIKKLWPNSFNITPIELTLGLWVKSGAVNIPTNFEENRGSLDF